jgi:ubiquinone/menaquinone biosynthesis C-methylase UbiE
VIGLDYSWEAIMQAYTKVAPHAAFMLADLPADLPFIDACFDAVMSNVALYMFNVP